jgi:hypothetical protein
MVTIDEIRVMKGQGKSEQDIRDELEKRGVSDRDVENALSQAAIRDAVASQSAQLSGMEGQVQRQQNSGRTQSVAQDMGPQQFQEKGRYFRGRSSQSGEYSSSPREQEAYDEMQPSVMEEDQQAVPEGSEEDYAEEAYAQTGGGYPYDSYSAGYGQYQPYQEAMSSDVITEISEQVVSERLAVLNDKLEEAIGFKGVAETKLSGLDGRLKRIEQIIDRLQLSLLQKVGDYVNDVKDIKSEISETRKSFKKLALKAGGSLGKKGRGREVP